MTRAEMKQLLAAMIDEHRLASVLLAIAELEAVKEDANAK